MSKKKHNSKTIWINMVFVIGMLFAWEIIAKLKLLGNNSELIFPSLEAIGRAFISIFCQGYAGITMWRYVANSMSLLLSGLVIGVCMAFVFSGISMINRVIYCIFNLLVSVFDLLPGVALLPVVIIVFGVKPQVIVFLVIHAVIWPMSRNLLDGFKAVPEIYIEAGKNMGLRKITLLWGVYLPASISFIVSGLKVGWARAWRGLISAEMIFGVASSPGIGFFINQMRTNLKNAEMYATLIVIVAIGVIVQYCILEPIEKQTVLKWGMAR